MTPQEIQIAKALAEMADEIFTGVLIAANCAFDTWPERLESPARVAQSIAGMLTNRAVLIEAPQERPQAMAAIINALSANMLRMEKQIAPQQ